MAPVSISALASITTPKAAPDYFANGRGVAGVATGESTNKRLGSGVELLLNFVIRECSPRFP
jgi:hypothetical protein